MYYIGFKKPNKVGILKKEVLDKHEKQLWEKWRQVNKTKGIVIQQEGN